jgi:DNA repair protein RecN (Recombination protein N)
MTSLVQINEVSLSLSNYVSSLEADPQLLEQLRERISEIARLERKYLKSEEELVVYFQRIKEELSQYQSGELDLDKLKQKEQLALTELRTCEAELTKQRKKVATKLEKQIEAELAGLNMNKAKFNVLVEPAKSSKFGADRVCFMIAANPGEPFKELGKVASGGELSRVLLILKTLLNEKHAPGLQVYDEVDAGIGGAVAQVVGEKLKKVSELGQVLIVTHSPQIAAFADHHYVVSKTSSEKMTNTNVRELSSNERVKEIARMLAGKEVSKKFEESAKELLSVNS